MWIWVISRVLQRTGFDVTIYSADALWPSEGARGKLRKWRLAEVAIPLVRYNPVSGQLQNLDHAEILVSFNKLSNAKVSFPMDNSGLLLFVRKQRNVQVIMEILYVQFSHTMEN